MKNTTQTLIDNLYDGGFIKEDANRVLLESMVRSWVVDIAQDMVSCSNDIRARLVDEQSRILGEEVKVGG